jgi:hypothetical protein
MQKQVHRSNSNCDCGDILNIAAGGYLGGKNISVNIPEDFTIIKDPSNI